MPLVVATIKLSRASVEEPIVWRVIVTLLLVTRLTPMPVLPSKARMPPTLSVSCELGSVPDTSPPPLARVSVLAEAVAETVWSEERP